MSAPNVVPFQQPLTRRNVTIFVDGRGFRAIGADAVRIADTTGIPLCTQGDRSSCAIASGGAAREFAALVDAGFTISVCAPFDRPTTGMVTV